MCNKRAVTRLRLISKPEKRFKTTMAKKICISSLHFRKKVEEPNKILRKRFKPVQEMELSLPPNRVQVLKLYTKDTYSLEYHWQIIYVKQTEMRNPYRIKQHRREVRYVSNEEQKITTSIFRNDRKTLIGIEAQSLVEAIILVIIHASNSASCLENRSSSILIDTTSYYC